MIQKIISFFCKKKQPIKKIESSILSETQHKDSLIDIIISLTKDQEVDLSIFIDTDNDLSKKNMFGYTQRCAEFLNIASSNKLKNQITSIILDQIKNEKNHALIENIIMFWALLDKEEQNKREKKSSRTYILPSQVFSNYIK